MKRTTSAIALMAASILGLTACGGGSDPLHPRDHGVGNRRCRWWRADRRRWGQLLRVDAARGDLRRRAARQGRRRLDQAQHRLARDLPAGPRGQLGAGVPGVHRALALYYDKAFTGTDADEVYAHVQKVLPDTLVVLDKSAAEDNDSIVVTSETATSKNLKTIDDLKAVAGDMALAAPPEFKERRRGSRSGVDLRRGVRVLPPAHRPGHRPGAEERPGRGGEHLLHRPGDRGQRLRGPRGHQAPVRVAEHRAARAGRPGRGGQGGAQRRLGQADHRVDRRDAEEDRHRQGRPRRRLPRSSSRPTVSADGWLEVLRHPSDGGELPPCRRYISDHT